MLANKKKIDYIFLTQRLSYKFVALFIQCNGIPKVVTETCSIVFRTLKTLSAYPPRAAVPPLFANVQGRCRLRHCTQACSLMRVRKENNTT
jgi:hypothetical protein